MKVSQDARFRFEREFYRLRFTCEYCSNFTGKACAHGFPTKEHRAAHYVSPTAAISFCKDFELS